MDTLSFLTGFVASALVFVLADLVQPEREHQRLRRLISRWSDRLWPVLATRAGKTMLCLAAAAIFLSSLFPPWIVFKIQEQGLTELSLGRRFLFTTPEPAMAVISLRIDFSRLFVEWIAILALTVIALLVRSTRPVLTEDEIAPLASANEEPDGP